jgi:hypothetical protein
VNPTAITRGSQHELFASDAFAVQPATHAGATTAKGRCRRLKVYAGMLFVDGVQVHAIIAATSQRQVALESDNTINDVRARWTVTMNERAVELATTSPGQILYCPDSNSQRQDANYVALKSKLLRTIEEHLRNLNQVGLQRIAADDIPKLAEAFGRMMSFFKGYTTAYIAGIGHMEFQGVIDFMLFQIKQMGDGDKLNFLKHVGRPLSNDEMVRYFFGL